MHKTQKLEFEVKDKIDLITFNQFTSSIFYIYHILYFLNYVSLCYDNLKEKAYNFLNDCEEIFSLKEYWDSKELIAALGGGILYFNSFEYFREEYSNIPRSTAIHMQLNFEFYNFF